MQSLFSLQEKVVLVTGGYGHLGAAMCRGLAAYGAHVQVLARSEEKFAARFDASQDGVSFVPCDIGSNQSIREALEAVFAKYQRLDVMVNNAMFTRGQAPLEIDDADWSYSIDGTLNSVYRCIRESVPYLQRQGRGKIINISSMYGMVSPDFAIYDDSPQFLNPPHYGAAKAGVLQLTRYFAQYLGAHNIQVNAISPGPFPSPKVQTDTTFMRALAQKTALKRIGQPEELIGSVVFLSSSASDYITGQNLVVDGGWTIS